MPYPLEPDAAEMRRLVDEAMRRIVAHIESLPSQPASNVEGATEFARTLIEPLPQRGQSYEHAARLSLRRGHPALVQLPPVPAISPTSRAAGSFTRRSRISSPMRSTATSASAPRRRALRAARGERRALVLRDRRVRRGQRRRADQRRLAGELHRDHRRAQRRSSATTFARATLYCGDQTHHAFQKAAMLAGFPAANIREIPSDAQFRVRVDRAGGGDRARPRRRLHAVHALPAAPARRPPARSTISTRSARVARAESIWFHVDGAYGAFFMLTERGRDAHARHRARPTRSSSIRTRRSSSRSAPARWSCATRALLRRAHSMHADYLPAFAGADELVDFCEISPELSRDFRGLRVWLPLKLFGIEPFRAAARREARSRRVGRRRAAQDRRHRDRRRAAASIAFARPFTTTDRRAATAS